MHWTPNENVCIFPFQDSDFAGDGGVDLYDDVMVPPSSGGGGNEANNRNSDGPGMNNDHRSDRNNDSGETNGGNYHHVGNNLAPSHMGRRHQLYIGNLTWVSCLIRIKNGVGGLFCSISS